MNPAYGFIMWIVIGAIAGFIASKLMGPREGLLADIVVGVIGALIGGFIARTAFGDDPSNNGFITSTAIAVGGAVLVLAIRRLFIKKSIVPGR